MVNHDGVTPLFEAAVFKMHVAFQGCVLFCMHGSNADLCGNMTGIVSHDVQATLPPIRWTCRQMGHLNAVLCHRLHPVPNHATNLTPSVTSVTLSSGSNPQPIKLQGHGSKPTPGLVNAVNAVNPISGLVGGKGLPNISSPLTALVKHCSHHSSRGPQQASSLIIAMCWKLAVVLFHPLSISS